MSGSSFSVFLIRTFYSELVRCWTPNKNMCIKKKKISENNNKPQLKRVVPEFRHMQNSKILNILKLICRLSKFNKILSLWLGCGKLVTYARITAYESLFKNKTNYKDLNASAEVKVTTLPLNSQKVLSGWLFFYAVHNKSEKIICLTY